jgi:excisionase family DNA binding protein
MIETLTSCAGGTGCASVLSMRTVHLDPDARERTSLVVEEIERLLGEGKHIAVTVAEEQELLSPQQAADRLGFSRQHVVRLINAGELEARKLPGSSYWQIPLAAVLAFEERGQRADEMADEFSRSLDALGAPLE